MSAASRTHRVLLVDDQQIIAESVRRTLADEPDIVYRHVLDPREAVATAESFEPTVILQDLVMPEVHGLELVQTYRQHDTLRHVPLVVLSVKEEPEVKAEAFRLGVNDYLVKLPSAVELLARIRYHSDSFLHARQSRQAFEALKASQEQLRTRNDEIRRQRDVLAKQTRELELKNRFIRKTFGRYLSDDVVASILETPDGLELGGELRVVTIMMSDLRGFTGIAETLTPEQLLKLLNGYLGTMADVITAYRGTIEEFLGDAVLAVFGAPNRHPDDAERAVACAVAMQLALAEVNARHAAEGLPAVEMGIALHTGEAVVGNIGSQTRAKYGAVGRHVNVAGRLESYTLGGQVLISEATLAAVGPQVELGNAFELKAKGFARSFQAYELRGIKGEHDLWLPDVDERLDTLHVPIEIHLHKVEDKMVQAERRSARIVAASRRGAKLAGTADLAALDNLRIRLLRADGTEIAEDLYAKVVEATDGEARVRFTSMAPGVLALLEHHTRERRAGPR